MRKCKCKTVDPNTYGQYILNIMSFTEFHNCIVRHLVTVI